MEHKELVEAPDFDWGIDRDDLINKDGKLKNIADLYLLAYNIKTNSDMAIPISIMNKKLLEVLYFNSESNILTSTQIYYVFKDESSIAINLLK